ncbi:response regulator [Magnetofaba australis]|nr:response regulator [Magnetofaba australis]
MINELSHDGASDAFDETIRILLIDDQSLTHRLLAAMLSDEPQFELTCRDSGRNLLRHILDVNPTLILLDINMPDVGGMDLLDELRGYRRTQQLPVIMLSVEDRAETKAEAFSKGANDYLIKLPERAEMVARLKLHGRGYQTLLRHQQSVQEQREEATRIRAIHDAALDAMITIDDGGVLMDLNPAAERMFGLSQEDLGGDAITILAPQEKQQAMREALVSFDPLLNHPFLDQRLEIQAMRRDGERFPAEISITFGVSRGQRLFTAQVRDITTRKAFEETLQEVNATLEERVRERTEALRLSNEQLLREAAERRGAEAERERFFQLIPDLLCVLDSDGRIVRANSAFQIVLGHEPGELAGALFENLTQDEDIGRVREQMITLRGAGMVREFPLRMRRDDGQVVWVEWSAIAREDRFFAVGRDVTRKLAAAEALRQSEARLSEAQHLAQLGSWAWDVGSAALFCSSELYRILRRRPDSQKSNAGLNLLLESIEPDDREKFEQALENARRGGKPISAMYRVRTPEDEIRHVRSLVRWEPGGRSEAGRLIGIMQDISDTIQAETLRIAKESAEAANEAKSAFLATMSHEIRTPLNAILGMGELLMENEPNPQRMRYLEVSYKAGETLLALINDILDLSKIEAGRVDLERRPFDLWALASGVTDLVGVAKGDKPLAVACQIDPHTPRWVIGDEERLRQVMINLVGNAVKFTPEGKVVLKLSISDVGWAELAVEDTGIGISPAELERIFHPFTQADASTTREFGGTGLGLTICKRLIDLMGGGITVTSEKGRGSVFSVHLPLESTTQSAVEELTAPQPESARAPGEPRAEAAQRVILLVDDSSDNRMLVQHFLKASAHQVEMAENGRQAVERYLQGGVDLVLMDIQMPIMDGYEATRQIRQWETEQGWTAVPVIALTAHALDSDREETRLAGCTRHLEKPLRKQRLLEALAEFGL